MSRNEKMAGKRCVVCGKPAETTFRGKPVCRDCYMGAEAAFHMGELSYYYPQLV